MTTNYFATAIVNTAKNGQDIMLFYCTTEYGQLQKFETSVLKKTGNKQLGGIHVFSGDTINSAQVLQQVDPYFAKFKVIDTIEHYVELL